MRRSLEPCQSGEGWVLNRTSVTLVWYMRNGMFLSLLRACCLVLCLRQCLVSMGTEAMTSNLMANLNSQMSFIHTLSPPRLPFNVLLRTRREKLFSGVFCLLLSSILVAPRTWLLFKTKVTIPRQIKCHK